MPVDIDFNQSSKDWKSTVFKTSIKRKQRYQWESSRCGYIKENNQKCVKKSHFRNRDNVSVDECDGKIYCWFHKKI